MPKGIPNKKKDEEVLESTEGVVETVPEVKEPEVKKSGLDALSAGQAYFEAPNGDIVIGDASKQQIWHRPMNKGKGGWINKQR